MPDETSEDSTLGKIGAAFHTFYPLIVSVVLTPFIVKFHVPWFGLALGVVLFALKRTWWTCIFGLLNAMAVLAMMIACVVAWIAFNKDEANNKGCLAAERSGASKCTLYCLDSSFSPQSTVWWEKQMNLSFGHFRTVHVSAV